MNTTKVVEGEALEFQAVNNTLFISFTANKERRKDPDPFFSVRIALVTDVIPEEDREPLPEEPKPPIVPKLEKPPITVDLNAF